MIPPLACTAFPPLAAYKFVDIRNGVGIQQGAVSSASYMDISFSFSKRAKDDIVNNVIM